MNIPPGIYAIALPALGFLGAAVISDFLKWRSDIRHLHLHKLEMCSEVLAEITDMVRINVSRGFDGIITVEKSPAIRLHALLSLYLPHSSQDSTRLINAYGEFESAMVSIKSIWDDETLPRSDRENRIRALVEEKGEPLGELVEQIGLAVENRHAKLQRWWSLP